MRVQSVFSVDLAAGFDDRKPAIEQAEIVDRLKWFLIENEAEVPFLDICVVLVGAADLVLKVGAFQALSKALYATHSPVLLTRVDP